MDKRIQPSEIVPWYEAAFGPGYGLVYPHRDLAEARSDARFLAGMRLPTPILDIACGSGRHLAALAELGVRALGLDLSPFQLRASEPGPTVLRADNRRMPLGAGTVGGVLSLFSSFGYLGSPARDLEVLREVARVLRPGGSLVLDQPNPGPLRSGLVAESRTRRGGVLVRERRWLTDAGRRVVKQVELEGPGAPPGWREELALYERGELEQLLERAGLEPVAAWGGLDGRPATARAPRLVLRATRGAV